MTSKLGRIGILSDLNNNKSLLLIYGLMEVVLVVAGILIALELDNWDKENNYREIEQQYYQSMKMELLRDRALLQEEIDENLAYMSRYYLRISTT